MRLAARPIDHGIAPDGSIWREGEVGDKDSATAAAPINRRLATQSGSWFRQMNRPRDAVQRRR